jgi:hypothetical protein
VLIPIVGVYTPGFQALPAVSWELVELITEEGPLGTPPESVTRPVTLPVLICADATLSTEFIKTANWGECSSARYSFALWKSGDGLVRRLRFRTAITEAREAIRVTHYRLKSAAIRQQPSSRGANHRQFKVTGKLTKRETS